MLIDDLERLPQQFKEGVRGIMLIQRNKDGQTGNAQRKSLKKISRNKEEWKQFVEAFWWLQRDSFQTHRIYTSVNPRNLEKAVHEFKLRSLTADYGSKDERDKFYMDIENRFFSCLMNPGCRNQSNFLIDCDSVEDYDKAKLVIPENLVIYEYETKNGRHIITSPFNPNEYDIEIKKDDLLYIG